HRYHLMNGNNKGQGAFHMDARGHYRNKQVIHMKEDFNHTLVIHFFRAGQKVQGRTAGIRLLETH
ncbi:hypothetical protein EZS27_041142, partial [termite gut metagenome]